MLSFSETASTQASKRELYFVLVYHNHLYLPCLAYFVSGTFFQGPKGVTIPPKRRKSLAFLRPSVGGSVVFYRIFLPQWRTKYLEAVVNLSFVGVSITRLSQGRCDLARLSSSNGVVCGPLISITRLSKHRSRRRRHLHH